MKTCRDILMCIGVALAVGWLLWQLALAAFEFGYRQERDIWQRGYNAAMAKLTDDERNIIAWNEWKVEHPKGSGASLVLHNGRLFDPRTGRGLIGYFEETATGYSRVRP